jgi:predicted dehydrogenase
MKTLQIGILGFGAMGKMHTLGYRTLPLYYDDLPVSIRLRAVCTRCSDVGAQARALGFAYATHRPEDIIKDPAIDVVHVCTPNLYHKDAVLAALAAGKHVYCDKPLATNAADAQEMAQAAQAASVTSQMCMNYRFLTATMRARELVDEGFLGDITCFNAAYRHSGSVDACRPMGWKQDARLGGGGVVLDLGSHVLDLLYHLMGRYRSVQAMTRVLYPRRPGANGAMADVTAEDHAVILARMENGAVGTIEATKIATGTNDELIFEIYGTRGAIRFNLMDPNWLYVFDNRIPEAPLGGSRGFTRVECVQRYPSPGGSFPSGKAPIGWERGHIHCLYSFIDRVARGLPGQPSLADGAYIQRVMEAVYESARTCAPVEI